MQAQPLPNSSQQITPTAPAGSRFEPLNPELPGFPAYTAGQAVTSLTSPDHNTLLILTSGYNLLNAPSGATAGQQVSSASTEFVFVYNIAKYPPVKTQVIQVPNTYQGMVFDPSGKTFYVSGGVDDNVHIYDLGNSGWAERSGSPISLGHYNAACAPLFGCGVGLSVSPEAAGIAITADGSTLVVANYYNDSISILTKNSSSVWSKTSELDLRPGKIDSANSGTPGGEYPLWVSIVGNTTAYVSSIRDREVDVVGLGSTPSLLSRIKVLGQPNKMALSPTQPYLYVAEDQSDTVAVINTISNKLINEIPVGAPERLLKSTPNLTGNNTNSVTVSPDGSTLYAANGNTNNVAVVALTTSGNGTVAGLIPTGRYPTSVSMNGDGTYMFVVNGKSPTGPNIGNCDGGAIPSLPAANCSAANQYNLQLIKAGFQSFPTPTGSQLTTLSQQVAVNN
ncbi:MAG: beta-propeller fold lactonase family protein [Ignavibacteriota bacterium]